MVGILPRVCMCVSWLVIADFYSFFGRGGKECKFRLMRSQMTLEII